MWLSLKEALFSKTMKNSTNFSNKPQSTEDQRRYVKCRDEKERETGTAFEMSVFVGRWYLQGTYFAMILTQVMWQCW